MRRSRSIRLTLLAASAVTLQACGEDVDTTDVFVPDLASCVERFGQGAEAECRATMTEAAVRHAATAPRFASVEACREATGGECETTPATLSSDKALANGGNSVVIPVMAGVLIGRMMANGMGRMVSPLHAGRPPAQCGPGQNPMQANCATRPTSSGGRHYYSGASYAGSAPERRGAAAFTPSATMASTIAGASAAGTTSVRRGGFGASARGYSSSS